MADSWLTRPIGELPFTKASWWTTPTPRPEGYVEPPRVLGSGAAADALGRIKTKELGQQAQAQSQQDFLSTPPLDLSRPKTAQEIVDAEFAGLIPNEVVVPEMLARPEEQAAPPVQQQALQAAQARYATARPITPEDALKAAQARYAGSPVGLAAEEIGLAKQEALSQLGQEQAGTAADISAADRYNRALASSEKDDQQQLRRFEQMRSEFDSSQAKRLRDMEDLKAEIAATKIDPANYWAKGSGFGHALSLMAVALGGFAQGYSGGKLPNTALNQLNDSINRDIEAQKANLANKRGVLSEAQNIYGLARQKFGDDQSAMDYTRARQNEALKNVAMRYQNEARTDKLKASAKYLTEHFANQENLYDLKVRQLYANAEAERMRAAANAQASAQSLAEKRYERMLELKRKGLDVQLLEQKVAEGMPGEAGGLQKIEKSVAEGFVPNAFALRKPDGTIEHQGAFVPGIGKEQATKIFEKQQAIDEFVDVLERMKSLPDKGYAGYWSPDTVDKAKRLSSEFTMKKNQAASLGAFDEGTARLLEGVDPTKNRNTREVVDELISASRRQRANNVPNATLGTLISRPSGFYGQIGVEGQQPTVNFTPAKVK